MIEIMLTKKKIMEVLTKKSAYKQHKKKSLKKKNKKSPTGRKWLGFCVAIQFEGKIETTVLKRARSKTPVWERVNFVFMKQCRRMTLVRQLNLSLLAHSLFYLFYHHLLTDNHSHFFSHLQQV